ncbi:MAG: fumarylacetoacetase [Thermoanaerobaculia bacterium]
MTDETHDLALRSWVESANDPATDFPLQNLPFGVFRREGEEPRVGMAIGDRILDLGASVDAGLLRTSLAAETFGQPRLNGIMAAGRTVARELRAAARNILLESFDRRAEVERCLVPQAEASLLLPAVIGDYTDFYASIHHATNVGSMFRPDNPLLPNYKWVPIGYHGRASSIVVSGTPFRRPAGQLKDPEGAPRFEACRRLDYETEVGLFVAGGNELGVPVRIGDAEEHIFGLCLVNDWSARDIQTWEYQPLGPFLGKSFTTSISPWVVTLDALEPFRVPAFERSAADPAPLPYLTSDRDRRLGGIDLTLEVWIESQKMRDAGIAPLRLSRGSFRDMYWTVAQLLAHHTSNGCNLQPGDLLASGTVSGTTKDSRGSLLELAWKGTEPIELPTGEQRRFLEDGDEVIMRGWCEREGFRRIGFGECRGRVLPAVG